MTGRGNRVDKRAQKTYLSAGEPGEKGRRPPRGRIAKDRRIFRFENKTTLTNPK